MRRLLGMALVSLATLSPAWVQADDQAIAQNILQKLQDKKESGKLKGFDINLDVEDGSVWMKGRVATQEQQDLALDVARRVPGVTQVVNDLTVASTSTKSSGSLVSTLKSSISRVTGAKTNRTEAKEETIAPVSATEPTDDAESNALVQKIASRLQEAKNSGQLRGFNVDIQCDGGTVWLSGHVANRQQHSLVIETVRRIRGVTQVVNDLKVASGSLGLAAHQAEGTGVARSSRITQAPHSEPLSYDPSVPSTSPRPLTNQVRNNVAMRQVPLAIAPSQAAMAQYESEGTPMPMHSAGPNVGIAPSRYDHPSMPGYAWPSYASYPNYAAVTYPKQYSPSAWPYIGPFYPYPQVPLGWRKVTMQWDDGWWFLDFKDR